MIKSHRSTTSLHSRHYSASVASAAATAVVAKLLPDSTIVHSGGSGGRGAYWVGLRLISHFAVFLGRVLAWCAVAFFFGRDEHSIEIGVDLEEREVLGLVTTGVLITRLVREAIVASEWMWGASLLAGSYLEIGWWRRDKELKKAVAFQFGRTRHT